MSVRLTVSGLTPGTWAFRFRAKNDNGKLGEWSPAFTYSVAGDTTPPPVPSQPNVTSVIGGVSVKWVESAYQTPVDFNRVDVYVSSGGGYTKFGSIASINSVVTYVPPEGVTGPFTFKFTGVDRSGNVSAFSAASDSVSAGTIGIDTTPPSSPSNLSVTAYNDPLDTSGATGYVDVSWTGSTSDDLLGHYVRYGRTSTVWDQYLFMESGQNSTRIYNLKSGTTYYFQVNATDGSNPSSYVPTTPVSILIPGDVVAPAAPQGLSAVSGLDYIIAYWDRNTEDDVDLARGEYQVQVSTSSSFLTIQEDIRITGTVATFNGLTTGTLYYVRVRAIDSSGNIGAWSTAASTTPSTIDASTSITSGTIVGNLIAANTIVGDKLQANTVDADRFKTNTGIAGIIYVGSDDSPTGTNRLVLDGASVLPKIYYGSGVYNNSNTPVYIDAAGKLSLKDQLVWDGSALTIRGSLNVTQSSTITANLNINSGGSLIVNGGAIRITGTAGRVEMNSLGIVGYNASTGGSALVTIQANTGQIVATGGQIGGFNLSSTSITTTNGSGYTVGMYNDGRLYMGPNFSVGSAGDVTITGTFTVAGTGQPVVSASQVQNHLGGTNITTISGSIINTGTINLNNVNVRSGTGANSIQIDSSGLRIYNSSGTNTVNLTPSGNATFTGTVTGSTFTGGSINVTGETINSASLDGDGNPTLDFGSANAFTSNYSRGGITNLGINAISIISANTGGVLSSWYPYFDGATDLGIKSSATGAYSTYRWRNLRLTANAYFGGDGTTNSVGPSVSGGALIKIYSTGEIYANTLGVASGTALVQSSGGFIRVQSSSRKYKENIIEIDKSGYLDIIAQLKPVTFNYKQEFAPDDYSTTISGLIAEDVNEIPELRGIVNNNFDGEPESISYDRLSTIIVLGIKEIKDRLDTIEQRLDVLES